MISPILSIAVLVFISSRGVAEAHLHLRQQQQILATGGDECDTPKKNSCSECINQAGKQCVWNYYFATCHPSTDDLPDFVKVSTADKCSVPAVEAKLCIGPKTCDGCLGRQDKDCRWNRGKEACEPHVSYKINSGTVTTDFHRQVEHIVDKKFCGKWGALRKALESKADHGERLAPVDPTMEVYEKNIHHYQNEWQHLTGNDGYCWRYTTSQILGMPYLVFEQMMKGIQLHLKEQAQGANDYPMLSKPLSVVFGTDKKDGWKNNNDANTPFKNDEGHGAILPFPALFVAELQKFIKAFPNAKLYKNVKEYNANATEVEKTRADLKEKGLLEETPPKAPEVAQKAPEDGKKSEDKVTLEDEVKALNLNVQKVFVNMAKNHKDLDPQLKKLISCTVAPKRVDNGKPDLKKLTDFLNGNPKRRRIIFTMLFKAGGGHVGVLLLDQGKLYYADGNGDKLDGELDAFDDNNLCQDLKTLIESGWNASAQLKKIQSVELWEAERTDDCMK